MCSESYTYFSSSSQASLPVWLLFSLSLPSPAPLDTDENSPPRHPQTCSAQRIPPIAGRRWSRAVATGNNFQWAGGKRRDKYLVIYQENYKFMKDAQRNRETRRGQLIFTWQLLRMSCPQFTFLSNRSMRRQRMRQWDGLAVVLKTWRSQSNEWQQLEKAHTWCQPMNLSISSDHLLPLWMSPPPLPILTILSWFFQYFPSTFTSI